MNLLVYFQTVFLATLLQQGHLTPSPEAYSSALFTALDSVKAAYAIEASYEKMGLVNIYKEIPSSRIDIRYSYPDNFLNKDLYGPYCACHLQSIAVEKLKQAYQYLQSEKPGYTFIFYDCTRPISVQQKMWNAMSHLAPIERSKYVSNPKNHSVHNYGLAIDMGLIDAKGEVCDMGTDFDYFGILAYPYEESRLLYSGKLTQNQVDNRRLMRRVMEKAGFRQQEFEWWHYNTMSRDKAKSLFKPMY